MNIVMKDKERKKKNMKNNYLGYMVDEYEIEKIKEQIREHLEEGRTNFNITIPEEFNEQDYEQIIQEVLEERNWF